MDRYSLTMTIPFPSARDKFTHFTTMATRWRDMDSRHHVNHAAYLTYLETSRLEFAEKLFGEDTIFIKISRVFFSQ